MKKVLILLAFALSAQSAFAGMTLTETTDLLSSSEVKKLHRITDAEINSIKVEKKAIMTEGYEYSVNLTYMPRLTAEEQANQEGPGICEAALVISGQDFCARDLFGCDAKVKVISNNCFQ